MNNDKDPNDTEQINAKFLSVFEATTHETRQRELLKNIMGEIVYRSKGILIFLIFPQKKELES